jgi:CheY-like chemotaxis protein
MRALRKVLVVDDDPVVGKSFDRVLSEKGYTVSSVPNGSDALDKLGREDYDVVFTDIRMPGMDGIEVAEQIKARRPWIPVVIVTGYGTAADETRAKAAGVSEFLHKPLSPEMIEGSARKAFRVIEGGAPKALLAEMAAAAPRAEVEAAVVPQPAVAAEERAWKTVALFLEKIALLLVAPFVGLAYAVALPFVGLAMLAWMGVDALANRWGNVARFLKNVALFLAAPFIGLAYTVLFPFVGLGMLAWMAARALVKRSESE